MIKKITDKKHINILASLCFIIYFTSYITRINYTAIISEIVKTEGFLKSDASLITTAAFFSYAIGQLISGFAAEKFQPKWLIFWGLITSSIFNLLMPLLPNIQYMVPIWFLNGFSQAMMWPPLLRIMSQYFESEALQKTIVNVSIASSAATISIYLFSPVLIVISGWKLVFVSSALIGFIVSFIWLVGFYKIDRHINEINIENANNNNLNATKNENGISNKHENNPPVLSLKKLFFSAGLLYILFAVILQGILRDGVTTWMPSYLSEVYNLKSVVSIFSVVLLPIFSILGTIFSARIFSKVIKNEIKTAIIMFFISLIAATIMSFVFSLNVFISIILSALITGSMHGVNLMLVVMVPTLFERYGKVSSMSGILNFFTYVGSAISTYLIAKISEQFGWHFTIAGWAFLALLGSLSTFLGFKKWSL